MSKTFLPSSPFSFVHLRNSAEFSTKFIHARISTDCVLSLHAKRKLHNDIVNNSIWFDAIVHLIAILSLVYNAHRYNAILFACFALTIPSIFYALLLRRSSDCREAKKNFFDYSIVLIGKSFAMRDFVLIQMQKCSKNRAQKKHTTKMNTNSNGIRFVAYLSIFIHWFTAEMVRRSESFFRPNKYPWNEIYSILGTWMVCWCFCCCSWWWDDRVQQPRFSVEIFDFSINFEIPVEVIPYNGYNGYHCYRANICDSKSYDENGISKKCFLKTRNFQKWFYFHQEWFYFHQKYLPMVSSTNGLGRKSLIQSIIFQY